MGKFFEKVKGFFKKIGNFFVDIYTKCVDFFKEKTKNVNWKEVWDKCTTGLLIFLMFSPVLILAYIFLWFIFK
ncbi:MAG: hypothetical protein IJW66_05565 [Clostridia bacterium]|nr:hypothetical protein [Clostridia bacterium]